MAQCSIDDCYNPVKARGWCTKHWKRWYKYGDPLFTHFIRGAGHRTTRGYTEMYDHGKKIHRHRYVMQQLLGRPLERWELVHHKDGDKTNDDPSNLELMTAAEHVPHHFLRRFVSETHAECAKCRMVKPHSEFSPDTSTHRRLKRQSRCKSCKAAYWREHHSDPS